MNNEKILLDDYPDVLEPKHIKEILGIGEKQTYEMLNHDPPPFHFVRVGRRIKIPKIAFERWFYGT